jgi:cobalt-zinc-cadmium efflux system outer membrane protein
MRRPLSLAVLSALLAIPALGQERPAGAPLTLQELEERALAKNPTLSQAAAAVRAAEGRWRQAGQKPNPSVGYRGSELTFDRTKAYRQVEHFMYVEQTVLTGRKLKRSRSVAEHARSEVEALGETQKQAVRNAVRGLYHDAQVAQRLVEVRGELARIAREAVTVSEDLLNVGQADRPDLLEAEIEAERAELALRAAEYARSGVWYVLGAVVGEPDLAPRPLAGDPEADVPVLDRETLAAVLLAGSPEVKAAQAAVRREQAEVERMRADRLGDILLQGGIGYNSDKSHGLGGWVGGAEVSFPLPLFNRQQGAVAAARAEAAGAEAEVGRVQMALRARLAREFQGYQTARGLVERYRTAVIPKAQTAHQMYLARFREMTAAYPQVLIAQRTLFQVKAEYLQSLGELWHHVVLLQGFLIGEGLDGLEAAGSLSALQDDEMSGSR